MSENPSVHITSKYKELYYDRFTDAKKDRLFDRMIDLFLLAAANGYIKNKFKPVIIKDSDSPFKWSNFSGSDITLIKSICLIHNDKDPHVLLNKEKMMDITESYANGGIEDICKVLDKEGSKVNNLLELLNENNIEQLLKEASNKGN
jgi:dnd system-associated protein 4